MRRERKENIPRQRTTIELVYLLIDKMQNPDAHVVDWDDDGKIRIYGFGETRLNSSGISHSLTINEIRDILREK